MAIKARAQTQPGTYALVRRALGGEANCFYACEQGHVVGTPFNTGPIVPELAALMVQFGCAFLCIWPIAEQPVQGMETDHGQD